MRPWPFYQERLDAVSRSFALCIPTLDQPLREWVALSYLLFRVLDTVEDAPFDDGPSQQRQFQRLRRFLHARPTSLELEAFVDAFPAKITDAECALVGETHLLLDDGYNLPIEVRSTIFRALERMALGMAAYMRRPAPLRLVDGDDVARYCCFVAGVVGEMLTHLWALERGAAPPRLQLAYHFGLFLQKVNILKDQGEDEAAGRFLVPDRTELIASLGRDAEGALAYLREIPRGDRYRTLCAWSLVLGAATVGKLGQPRQDRAETRALLARTSAIIDDDDALAAMFYDLMPRLPICEPRRPRAKPESFAWFRDTLAAPLSEAELAGLGIGRAG